MSGRADGSGPRTYVLTGATGFLGGHLMAALLERGDRLVVLGRSSNGTPLRERILRYARWLGRSGQIDRVESIEADFLRPRCGLSPAVYESLCSRALPIIHAASDTRFSEVKRSEITETNVLGLKGVLGLAEDGRAPFFHYISTAFASGTGSGGCPERVADTEEFANVYEETKARAEREVIAACRRGAIPYTLIRPSIVYGDSRTGRSTRFNALYFNVKSLHLIRDIYLGDIRKNGGRKSGAHGVSLDEDGTLHLPLRIRLPRRGSLNLVPIDYFVAATLAILDGAEDESVYHVTNPRPNDLEELAGFCESFLRIRGIDIRYSPRDGEVLSPPEALLNRLIEPYRPYLADTRRFERARTDTVTGGLPVPRLTYDNFERCMQYAVDMKWRDGLQFDIEGGSQ